MNSKKTIVLLLLMALVACLLLSGCSGLIKPSIGEMNTAALEEEAAQTAETGASGEATAAASGEVTTDASGEATDTASGEASGETGSAEPAGAAMEGNVVYRFEYATVMSSSLGAMQDFLAYVELYDTPNANGDTGIISISLGSNASTKTCTWTLEDGVFLLQVDEFTSYESRDLNGVPNIVGVGYAFMMNSGTVDIPLVQGEVAGSAAAAPAAEAAAPAAAEAPAEAADAASAEPAASASGEMSEPASGEAA